MSIFLYKFFHNETNERTENGLVKKIPRDFNDWPVSWKTIVFKKYSLFREIILTREKSFFFNDLLSRRKSGTKFFKSNEVTLEKISYILRCGYGLQEISNKDFDRKSTRTVPSGGQRYSLELYYFCFKKTGNLVPGIYHYGVERHVLEPVIFTEITKDNLASFTPQESIIEPNGMFCLTSFFERTVVKYGSRGYRYILLEAGHIGQNILLAGIEKDLYITPIGSINEEKVEAFIGLNGSRERIVYTLFV